MNSDVLTSMLVALGEFHATCYHYIHSYEGGVETFAEDNPCLRNCSWFDNMPGGQFEQVFNQMFDTISKVIESGGDAEMAAKLSAQKQCWKQVTDDVFKLEERDFVTLLHGDAWFKNVLLRYVRIRLHFWTHGSDSSFGNVKRRDIHGDRADLASVYLRGDLLLY